MNQKKHHNDNRVNKQDKTQSILAKRIHFDQIDSTNTWAKTHPEEWNPAGVTLITASFQKAGRGRFKRVWVSPPNLNIYATFCFWMDSKRTDIGHIPQLLALTTTQMLEKEGFAPKIKWPNDILIEGKKIGGILCETILEEEKRGVVCGIGLNVNMPLDILTQIDRPATSMLVEKERTFEIDAVSKCLVDFFLEALGKFIDQGFSPFFPLLEERSALIRGQTVRFHDNQTLIEAKFEQLLSNGSVELRLSSGELKIFHAGEFI